MICSEVRPLLDLLSDSELEKKDIALVFEHLHGCTECKNEWQGMEQLQALFKDARENTQVPSSLTEKIDRKISAGARSEKRALAFAASILIAGGLSFFAFRTISTRRVEVSSSTAESLLAISNDQVSLVANVNQLPGRLGYEPKFVRLPGWKMKSAGVVGQNSPLVRFTFTKNGAPEAQTLVCFQGRAGRIKYDATSLRAETFANKSVAFGKKGELTFAVWTQNDRDYLFVSSMPEAELRKIIEQA